LGYGGLIMLNIQDVMETDSTKLARMTELERCTLDNPAYLESAIELAAEGKADVLCAWGKPGHKHGPAAWLAECAEKANVTLYCLAKNKDGSPAHPLYQPYAKAFEWFAGPTDGMLALDAYRAQQ
jgi:hypothetical protein